MKTVVSRMITSRIWQGMLVTTLLATAAVIFLWSDTSIDIDDAPITYRYAENIAAGNGFVYNLGERVQGTSTPLYTILLAAARLIGIPIPLSSNAIGFLASVGTIAVTMAIVQKLTGSFLAATLSGIILLGQGSFIRYSMAGMETPFYTLLIGSSLLALAYKRTLLSASLAAFAALTRLDGFAVVGAILLSCFMQQRRFPFKETLLIACMVGPWLVFSTLYFGSPIPLSMLAKQQHLLAAQGDRFWIWEYLFINPLRGSLYLLPFIVLGLGLSVRNRAERFQWSATITWLVAYLVAYTLVGIPLYEWYLMPAFPVLSILAALGIEGATRVTMPHLAAWVHLVAAILIGALVLPPYYTDAYNSVKDFKGYLLQVEGTRVLIGSWLGENTSPESKIFTGGIGHIGYISNRYVIDGAGLVTPPQYRTLYRPDYYIYNGSPTDNRCTIVKEWDTGWAFDPKTFSVSVCN